MQMNAMISAMMPTATNTVYTLLVGFTKIWSPCKRLMEIPVVNCQMPPQSTRAANPAKLQLRPHFSALMHLANRRALQAAGGRVWINLDDRQITPVSYTHLRAHETGRNLVCRLLLEKKQKKQTNIT